MLVTINHVIDPFFNARIMAAKHFYKRELTRGSSVTIDGFKASVGRMEASKVNIYPDDIMDGTIPTIMRDRVERFFNALSKNEWDVKIINGDNLPFKYNIDENTNDLIHAAPDTFDEPREETKGTGFLPVFNLRKPYRGNTALSFQQTVLIMYLMKKAEEEKSDIIILDRVRRKQISHIATQYDLLISADKVLQIVKSELLKIVLSYEIGGGLIEIRFKPGYRSAYRVVLPAGASLSLRGYDDRAGKA